MEFSVPCRFPRNSVHDPNQATRMHNRVHSKALSDWTSEFELAEILREPDLW
jgi:hypothetical protein